MNDTISIAQDIIDKYELDYGNAEICPQGDEVYITIEAPNNSTVTVYVPNDANKKTILKTLVQRTLEFDADDEFDELWFAEFGEHNGFTPSQFLRMLTEDMKYFEWTSDRLVDELVKDRIDMNTALFHMTACKAMLAVLQSADRDRLRVLDVRGWSGLTDEELQLLAHAEPSDVARALDEDDYDMFDRGWRVDVDCGGVLPHASEYRVSGMTLALDGMTVRETVVAGLNLLNKE